MIIKSGNLLLFSPDALKIEYHGGMEYKYYIVAYKNGHRFFVKGYTQEKPARLKLDVLNEKIKAGKEAVEI